MCVWCDAIVRSIFGSEECLVCAENKISRSSHHHRIASESAILKTEDDIVNDDDDDDKSYHTTKNILNIFKQ